MFHYNRFRFVIYRLGFFISFAELNIQANQSIKLPVGVSCFLGIKLIRKNICITFNIDSQTIIQT